MKIVIITAGGAGMFCGSCMQDNTLVRSLRLAGADAILLPTYTPIRVDEDNASEQRVFLGGINVYLDSRLPGWRLLPRSMKRWLDRPTFVRWLSQLSSSTNARDLGPLTIDLLSGVHGPQKAEIRELIRWLCDDLQPDAIIFSNALLSGVVPELRRQYSGRLFCLLQGDDIFLEALPEPWRQRALKLVSENSSHFDGLLTHSHYYATFMQDYLKLSSDHVRVIPLSLDLADDPSVTHAVKPHQEALTVGYFARICPEKGAFRFLDMAERVLPRRSDMQMVMGGYLPEQHRREFESRLMSIRRQVGDRLRYEGSPPGRDAKFRMLQSFDWLCVPTLYREPKGLYVLEAALCGVPSLVPNHGAFPERIQALGAGLLFDPEDIKSLEDRLLNLAAPPEAVIQFLPEACRQLHSMAQTGHQVLHQLH
jgi:glycosyltransferase involved in cell wall biosynthesis